MELDHIYSAIFWVAVVLVLAVELESWVQLDPKSFRSHVLNLRYRALNVQSRVLAVVGDFRSARYYKPWRSSTPLIIVSSKAQVAELADASALSQREVYADMFQFRRTMNKYDQTDHSMTRSRLFGRLLNVDGPRRLPGLFPLLRERVSEALDEQLARVGKETICADGSVATVAPIADTVRRIASSCMGLMFFGKSLSSDTEFAAALLQYPKDLINIMMTNMLAPRFVAPFLHSVITRRGRAMHLIQDQIAAKIAEPELWDEDEEIKALTLLQNMTQLSSRNAEYWTPEMLSQALLGIWFAAAHQPWMNLDFILLELCVRPEWQAALRDEIGDLDNLQYEDLDRMPLLDGFIKETVRLSPLDNLAVRRKATRDYTFAGGAPFCPKGSTVCVSSYDAMHNPQQYTDPNSFNPRRFLADSMLEKRFAEVSEKMPVWGYGSLACPGRHHASLVIKVILAHIVTNYDLELENENARRKWMWETFTMPYESTNMLLKRVSGRKFEV